jgi:hypothetical protein
MTLICLVAATVLVGSTMTRDRALAQMPASPRIQVEALFDPVVDDLLEASPTFLQQYERISETPLVKVSIRALPKGEESCCRARTTIRRYQSGAIIAWVEIPSPRTKEEYAELLGHEFEHILEQIDLIDLDAQADDGVGVTRLGDATYETARARRAGQAVAREAIRRTTSEETRLRR